jgi:subtilisin family serine protease
MKTMSSEGYHRNVSVRRLAAVLALLALAACESRDAGPLQPRETSGESAGQRPFYYYQGSPIFLRADPIRLVVATRVSAPAPALVAHLAPLGMRIVSSKALFQSPDHLVLTLSGGTDTSVREAVRRLRTDARFQFASAVYKTDDGFDVVPLNRLTVRFRDGVTRNQVDSLNAMMGTTIVRQPRTGSRAAIYWLAYPLQSDPLDVASRFYKHPLVLWSDPDKLTDRRLAGPPSDPYYNLQYYLKNTQTLIDDNVEPAWDLTTGSPTIAVAVIDQGVDADHPDFGGRVELGFDAFGLNSPNCTDCASQPFGNDGHGTHVAGIIVAQHNGVGMAGIAPQVRLIPVRIFRNCENPNCYVGDAGAASAIRWAWDIAGADVLSNSWGGGPPSDDITDAINDGVAQGRGGKGAMIVFSAGNTSNRSGVSLVCGEPVCGLNYPATLSSVIAVGAINRNGGLTNYTPEGPQLDIVAPSGHVTNTCVGDVVTTDLPGSPGCNDGPGGSVNYTSTFSGTSAAAPQVAAVMALLYSREPGLLQSEARDRLLDHAWPMGPANQFGRGRVNAYATILIHVDAPTVTTADVNNGLAHLAWATVANAATYRVERRAMNLDPGGSCTTPWEVWDQTPDTEMWTEPVIEYLGTNQEFSGLPMYVYRVIAVHAFGDPSAPSTTHYFRTWPDQGC